MATHKIHIDNNAFYFITFSCYKWLNLLQESNIYDYLSYWSGKLIENGCELNGFVIMPNHIHLLVFSRNTKYSLNEVIAESKRFLAYEIVKRLKRLRKNKLLKIMEDGVQKNERIVGKKHQVFKLSFDAKLLESEEEITNVLDYIHRNPSQGKWNLIDDFTKYPYSSAGYYEGVEGGFLNVTD